MKRGGRSSTTAAREKTEMGQEKAVVCGGRRPGLTIVSFSLPSGEKFKTIAASKPRRYSNPSWEKLPMSALGERPK